MVYMNKSADTKKRVVVFGVFDGIHEGHRYLFHQAKSHGEELFVIVGRDQTTSRLKNQRPRLSEYDRLHGVLREQWVADAVLGDERLSTYYVLEQLNQDVICLGYDQHELAQDLRRWMAEQARLIPTVTLQPFKPGHFHNSLLR